MAVRTTVRARKAHRDAKTLCTVRCTANARTHSQGERTARTHPLGCALYAPRRAHFNEGGWVCVW
jgi:hypothetical protein